MTPPKVKIAACTELVKNEKTLVPEPCKTRIPYGDRCPNSSEHVLKYKTGFCENKDCEGTKRLSRTGKPHKTCSWWKHCPCSCHTMFDRMFTMSEMPRQLVDNSGYVPDRGDYWLPTPEERMQLLASSSSHLVNVPILLESPLPAVVPATIRREYAPTTSGRAAPGELESWIKKQCDIWLVEAEEFPCTPPYIAESIGKDEGIKPPSVGAISAAFERWTKLGFAVIEKKPTRFVSYTPDGVKLGLEGCKDRAKRQHKMSEAQAKRGVLR